MFFFSPYSSSDVAASPVRGKEPSIATANNIDTLLGATESSEIVQPPEAVQDKVHFIFNNISQANLQQKVRSKEITPELAWRVLLELQFRLGCLWRYGDMCGHGISWFNDCAVFQKFSNMAGRDIGKVLHHATYDLTTAFC